MMVWITIHMLFHSELMHKLGIVQSLTLSITKFCTYHIRSTFHEVLRFLLPRVCHFVEDLLSPSHLYSKIKPFRFQLTLLDNTHPFPLLSRYK